MNINQVVNVMFVAKVSDEMRHQKTSAKKALDCFGFLVEDFNISDIAYKIQILNLWPVFSNNHY